MIVLNYTPPLIWRVQSEKRRVRWSAGPWFDILLQCEFIESITSLH